MCPHSVPISEECEVVQQSTLHQRVYPLRCIAQHSNIRTDNSLTKPASNLDLGVQ